MPPVEYIVFGVCALFFVAIVAAVVLAVIVKLARSQSGKRTIAIAPRVGDEPSLLDLVDGLTSGEDRRRRRQRLTDRLYDLASDTPPVPPKA